MGGFLGTTHPVIMCYKVFLRKYDAMEPRIRREFELVHGTRLGPALMVFHVHFMWRSWLSDQIDSEAHLPLPYFCTGLRTLEQNNILSWVPSYANVPQLQAMGQVTRTIWVAQQQGQILSAGNVGNTNG
jgi:hypothetical protein